MHPGSLRCSSVAYSRYAPLLAPCDPGASAPSVHSTFWDRTLVPRATEARAPARAPRVCPGVCVVLSAACVLGLLGARLASSATRPPKVLVLGTPEPRPSSAGERPAAADDDAGAIAVAQASLIETLVEVRAQDAAAWTRLAEGGRVHTGDRLRTGVDSVARIDFSWMSVTLAPSSELLVRKNRVLGLNLVSGRVELASERDDLVKLDTPEARVRGRGHVVVRRDGQTTLVSLLHGEARVSAQRGSTGLTSGQGCRVEARGACAPTPLPDAPARLAPGSDPTYVAVGRPVRLGWSAPASSFHVQVLSFDADVVLAQRDVQAAALDLSVPWPGLYRFRVSARGSEGLEGPPSLEGLFQVMPADWLKSGTDPQP